MLYAVEKATERRSRVAQPVGVPLLQEVNVHDGLDLVGERSRPCVNLQEVQRLLPHHRVTQLALKADALHFDHTTCTQVNTQHIGWRGSQAGAVGNRGLARIRP